MISTTSGRQRKMLNVLLICFWILFAFVWFFLGWNDSELFRAGWWFDEAGHALFGIAGALTLLHMYRSYALHGLFWFARQKLLAAVVVANVILAGVLWELVELMWGLYFQPEYFV